MPRDYRTLDLQPLAPALGAQVRNIDVTRLDDARFAELRRALAEFGVLCCRDQQLSPAQHLAFARRWGEINVNRFFTPVDGHPQIAEVRKEPAHSDNIGNGWHTDHSYDAAPAMGSILYALEVPASGGDTLFASMYRAYDALSDGLKHTLRGLRALHSSRHVFGPARYLKGGDLAGRLHNPDQAIQDAIHPVVLEHPDSGRPALYVNPGFTVRFDGWTEQESQPLLNYLYQHAVRPEFVARLQWRPGTLAIWDNRTTWHYALNDYPGQRRVMHRITVEGRAFAEAAA